MATTTTNFGWDIPQSTDLVKDGATAIAALGQDIDTAFVDFKGGTTGQVLKKTSATDLDVEWGTPSSGLTLINTTSFSGVSSVSLATNSFTTAYDNYMLNITFDLTTGTNAELLFKGRTAGSDISTANYNLQQLGVSGTGATPFRLTGATNGKLALIDSLNPNIVSALLFSPKLTAKTVVITNTFSPNGGARYEDLKNLFNATDSFDSITFYPSSSTITGKALLYGFNQ
jgi:hypothetical protein